MMVPVTIRFEGWATTEVSMPDDYKSGAEISDDAIRVALRPSAWDDFGVFDVLDVQMEV